MNVTDNFGVFLFNEIGLLIAFEGKAITPSIFTVGGIVGPDAHYVPFYLIHSFEITVRAGYLDNIILINGI